jgi:hypothetical protein
VAAGAGADMTNVSVRRSPFMERGNDPLIGLKIKLDRPIDRDRPCCRNICIIAAGKGPHAGELHCADCGQHRGWLSKPTAHWIEHIATRFGAPSTPIIVRKSHTFEEEAPPAETGSR